MAKEIKAPHKYNSNVILTIFLAGSIEEGKAKDWQADVVKLMAKYSVLLLNPRRDDWDASWEQSIKNKQFKQQVTWELDGQDNADVILMYFDPETKSPISLQEQGLYADKHKLHVVCPQGFWRKGNVDIVCERYDIPQYDTLKQAVDAIIDTYGLIEDK